MIRDGNVVKTVMRSFSLQEISAVDRPAQKGAKATIMKRDFLEKADYAMAITTMTAGHTHLITMGGGDLTRRAGDTSFVDGHCHPWIMNEAGDVIVGAAMGHNHGIEVISKREFDSEEGEHGATDILPGSGKLADLSGKNDETAGEGQTAEDTAAREDQNMTQQSDNAAETTAVEQLEQQVAELTKRAEHAESVAAMSGSHIEYYKSIVDASEAEAFISMDDSARDQEIVKAAQTNKVVYTAVDGTEYRKNDDPRLIKMAQEMDKEKKKRKEMEEAAYKADLEKRASELGHIPGDVNARVALLKGIDSLQQEEKDAALTALKAQNERLGKAFTTVGTTLAPNDDVDPLDSMADEIAKRENVSFEVAYSKALRSAEGQEIYKRHLSKRGMGN